MAFSAVNSYSNKKRGHQTNSATSAKPVVIRLPCQKMNWALFEMWVCWMLIVCVCVCFFLNYYRMIRSCMLPRCCGKREKGCQTYIPRCWELAQHGVAGFCCICRHWCLGTRRNLVLQYIQDGKQNGKRHEGYRRGLWQGGKDGDGYHDLDGGFDIHGIDFAQNGACHVGVIDGR